MAPVPAILAGSVQGLQTTSSISNSFKKINPLIFKAFHTFGLSGMPNAIVSGRQSVSTCLPTNNNSPEADLSIRQWIPRNAMRAVP
jgi:hypothetical protein